jgi:hypothetical protein
MKNPVSARGVHNWISVALVLPLFIIGMSTFFMTHEKSLGNFVIAYTDAPLELKDLLYTTDGRQFLATKNGVFQLVNNKLEPIYALQGHEIRTLELLNDGHVLAAGKHGLWLGKTDGNWIKLYDADIHGMQIQSQTWYLITKEQGVLSSKDQGLSWKNDLNISQALATMNDKQPLQLAKFMHDLHTGKALLGNHYEWIWADLLALVLVLLSLTGI